MKPVLYYLLQVIVASGILYGYYHLALRNKKFHKYNRFYLLASTVVSVTIPFLNIPVYFTQSDTNNSFVLQTLTNFSISSSNPSIVYDAPKTNWFTLENVTRLFYILVATLIFLRIVFSLFKIKRIIKNNIVEKVDSIHFINTTEPGTPFSFFRWLFWNKKIELKSEKGEQIFRHELFHINQKHSWDTMYLEFLTVIFWINPFFHLIKKETKAVHEFLADQFAVNENSKWEYAELLLMQVLNTQQRLVTPFFHNQIKRRIAMLTTSKKPSYQYLRKLMIFPVTAVVIGLFAFSYKNKHEKLVNKDQVIIPFTNNDTTPLKAVPPVTGTMTISGIDSGTNISKIVLNGKEFFVRNINIDGTENVKVDSVELHINSTSAKDTTEKPLIILDGLRQKKSEEALNKIDPATIERVNVLKGIEATKKYGSDGKNGVIEIITKNNAKKIVQTNTEENIVGSADKIFTQVEIPPSFPGGDSKWSQYVKAQLNQKIPVQNGAKDRTYTVIVQFVVKTDSTLINIRALTNHGFGMEEEAIRFISKGPRWFPAIQNGNQVNAIKNQPVTFVIAHEDSMLKIPSQQLTTTNQGIPKISMALLKKSTPLQLLKLAEGTEVVSYNFAIDLSNDDIAEVPNTGNKFNPSTINYISKATVGRTIIFEQIKIKKDGEEKRLPALMYEITN